MADALSALFVVFVFRTIIRNDKLTFAILVVVFAALNTIGAINPWIQFPAAFVTIGLQLFTLTRFGLVAMAVAVYVNSILLNLPITFRMSEWYAGAGLQGLFAIILLATYGVWLSLKNRPILNLAGAEK